MYWDIRDEIITRIGASGGWVNCHAHIDRAYTVNRENYALSQRLRSEKWILNSELRQRSTVNQIYNRMAMAVEHLLAQGVTALGTFIDVDSDVQDKAKKGGS